MVAASRLFYEAALTLAGSVLLGSLTYALIGLAPQKRALQAIGLYDALTGLPNRRLLMENLQMALARARRTNASVVCYLDLDGFKSVNDRFGHAVGDRLLIEIAHRFKLCLRACDTLLHCADQAMYLAKLRRKNMFRFAVRE